MYWGTHAYSEVTESVGSYTCLKSKGVAKEKNHKGAFVVSQDKTSGKGDEADEIISDKAELQ